MSDVSIGRDRIAKGKMREAALPLVLVVGSALAYAIVALITGQIAQLNWDGVAGLLQRMVALGVVAIGQTFVILVGSIDLSVAHLISLGAIIATFVMQGDPGLIWLGILAAMLAGILVGAINGLLVTLMKVNPLIATLGVGMILQGILATTYGTMQANAPTDYRTLAYGSLGEVPYALLLLAAIGMIAAFVLRRTIAGARVYSVGGNPISARLAGIRTDRVVLAAHVVSGACAAVAGLYLASRLGTANPWLGRNGGYDLDSIAVVVIGGTLLAGGKGGVGGTLAGVFLFATIDAVFNMLQIDPFLGQVLRGAVVVLAVAYHSVRQKGHIA
ncbi:ABC transporter permease [Rhizobium sp. P38BS-XIX]|uniref:ABC transporter permease n=1 Tax=Rhizobium sp. P38BS-XIX TaxID=2726740 RepID=UPI001FEF8495|nr:ABC transporter permease [Rhizobium sp. P38BS-XIX]